MQNVLQGSTTDSPKIEKVNVEHDVGYSPYPPNSTNSNPAKSETKTYSQHFRFMTDSSKSEKHSVSEEFKEATKFFLSPEKARFVDPETQARFIALLPQIPVLQTGECLNKLGYDIELVPSRHINRLTVEMMGRKIFRCCIKNLLFNLDCEDDKICQRVVDVVQEANTRMYADENVPLFALITEGMRHLQKIKYPRNTADLFAPGIHLWYEIPAGDIIDMPYMSDQ